MYANKNYTGVMYEYLKNAGSKIAKRVFNVMDYDVLEIWVDKDNYFFIEQVNTNYPIPKYVEKWIAKEMKHRKYKSVFY